MIILVLVLVLHGCAVTVSSTGAKNLLQGDDNCHVGRPCYSCEKIGVTVLIWCFSCLLQTQKEHSLECPSL
jgi:hypothetical protein